MRASLALLITPALAAGDPAEVSTVVATPLGGSKFGCNSFVQEPIGVACANLSHVAAHAG